MMTIERIIVVGLEDIKAVTFECQGCKARITLAADKLKEVPRSCAACNVIWRVPIGADVYPDVPASAALIQAIVTLRILVREGQQNFKILLEFDETSSASREAV
jgi:hypothetical protein